jgi:hypothetical protein
MAMKINKTPNQSIYQTADLSCAATLSLFFPIEEIDKSNPRRAFFSFAQTDKFDKVLSQFQRGELKVEPRAFFDAIKNLKTRLYEPY